MTVSKNHMCRHSQRECPPGGRVCLPLMPNRRELRAKTHVSPPGQYNNNNIIIIIIINDAVLPWSILSICTIDVQESFSCSCRLWKFRLFSSGSAHVRNFQGIFFWTAQSVPYVYGFVTDKPAYYNNNKNLANSMFGFNLTEQKTSHLNFNHWVTLSFKSCNGSHTSLKKGHNQDHVTRL